MLASAHTETFRAIYPGHGVWGTDQGWQGQVPLSCRRNHGGGKGTLGRRWLWTGRGDSHFDARGLPTSVPRGLGRRPRGDTHTQAVLERVSLL